MPSRPTSPRMTCAVPHSLSGRRSVGRAFGATAAARSKWSTACPRRPRPAPAGTRRALIGHKVDQDAKGNNTFLVAQYQLAASLNGST